MYNPPIKLNGNSPKQLTPKNPIQLLVEELQSVIKNAVETIKELSKTAEEIKQDAEKKTEELKNEAIDFIKSIEPKNGDDGIDGEPGEPGEIPEIDYDSIVEDVLAKITPPEPQNVDISDVIEKVIAQIPKPEKIDVKKLKSDILKSLPEKKGDLKIITENVEIDPMAIIEKILALPEDKFKLTTKHIDGLQQTIDAIKNQVGRKGYLHGGGDTVVAGQNITITANANGTKTISSNPGGTPIQEIPQGNINGINTNFVLSHTPLSNTLLVIRGGVTMFTLTGDYTILNKTITMTIAPPTGVTLVAAYSY